MHRRKIKGKKFGRETGSRKALLRSLATAVILYEKIDTTKTKAKEAQKVVERLIAYAKRGSLEDIRRLNDYLLERNAAKKMTQELSELYKEREGGYTRVINLGPREGDNAPMARLELLDTEKLTAGKSKQTREEKKEIVEKKNSSGEIKNKKSSIKNTTKKSKI